MEITKIVYSKVERKNDKYPLARCFVIVDDCLKLNSIAIFDGDKGRYIVLPGADRKNYVSAQNAIETRRDNGDGSASRKNGMEEFFHPVDRSFFFNFSETILRGYERFLDSGEKMYRPNKQEV